MFPRNRNKLLIKPEDKGLQLKPYPNVTIFFNCPICCTFPFLNFIFTLFSIDGAATNKHVGTTLNTAKLLYEYDVSVKVMELPEEIKDPGEISKDKFMELKETNVVEFDEIYYLRNIIK